MKKIIYIFAFVLITTSCDKGFEDTNVDPTTTPQTGINNKFATAVLYAAGQRYESWRANLIYCSTMIQHLANTQGYWNGDKYTYSASYAEAFWTAQYPQTIKAIEDMKSQMEEEGDTESPEYAMVRILRVFAYHRITDLYGDIPYSEAGKAWTEGNTRPAYDRQEDIYFDMLNELEESAALLDGAGVSELGSSDIIFEGDTSKWQKWANSLMLRLGLRLVKVNASAAQEWATKAIAGGVMESNADIAYVQHEEGNGIVQNGNGETFTSDSSPRLSKTFVDFLQGDPRLTIYGALPESTGEDGGVRTDEERLAPENQKGLPNGFDSSTLEDYEGGNDLNTYTEPNRIYITAESAPMFFQTYAEVEFMLAECAVRWGMGGNPEAHYDAGVKAAMQYLQLYTLDATISEEEIADYLANNPYDPANALEQINTQYWAAVFLNEYEAYANWRRTGYPVLTPVNYPGNVTDGTIPRRLTYLTTEELTNGQNYQAALDNQGPDLLTTRIWWDVE